MFGSVRKTVKIVDICREVEIVVSGRLSTDDTNPPPVISKARPSSAKQIPTGNQKPLLPPPPSKQAVKEANKKLLNAYNNIKETLTKANKPEKPKPEATFANDITKNAIPALPPPPKTAPTTTVAATAATVRPTTTTTTKVENHLQRLPPPPPLPPPTTKVVPSTTTVIPTATTTNTVATKVEESIQETSRKQSKVVQQPNSIIDKKDPPVQVKSTTGLTGVPISEPRSHEFTIVEPSPGKMWSSRNRMLIDTDGDGDDDVAFLSGSGESRHGLYNSNKRDLYERGHVAQCSRCTAVTLTVFIFTTIFLTSLAAAFVRPFDFSGECPTYSEFEDHPDIHETVLDEEDLLATNGEPFPWDDIRLPSFIQPVRYDIELTPNLTTLWVKGIEKLIFTVSEETNFIVFHSKNITITSRTINERLKVEQMLEYPRREQVYLETDEYMVPGVTYAIRLKFQYKLSHHLEGFYLSEYVDGQGQKRRIASSHFEPTYARRAFPCFDEPHLKARFLMTITHDRDMVAFFNTPKNVEDDVRGKPNQIRDEFEESVEMSTYLVAFVVCDFETVSQMSGKKINVSVIAAKDKISQAGFALRAATQLMDYYDQFFGVPYPLKKQDLIAIPEFGAGAMENWGLITYRETSLLYSEEETSAKAKQWIGIVVAHELAHQWFGNLVTMMWWNDLWLNEGFASWMEYRGVDHIQPDWHMMDQFLIDMIAPALDLDSLTTSHPISVEVKDPKEIEAIFDTISYKKGASIIHMLERTVGEKTIRAGLSSYLNSHKFGNAVTNDLWRAVSEAWNDTYHNFTVQEMMDTWTLQMGYPLVVFDQLNDTNIYTIRQERFYKAMNINDSSITNRLDQDSDYKWIVPVDYETNLEDFRDSFILNKSTTYEVEFPSDVTWIKANMNGTGFYRVNYPKENWDGLTHALITEHTIFSTADRTQLINDAFSLSQAGLVAVTVPLEMCMYLLKENEFVPWASALGHLKKWKQVLQETELIPQLNAFIRHLVSPMYNKVGWVDKGSHTDRLMRNLILTEAVSARMPEAVEKAGTFFEALKKSNTPIPADFRWIAYSAGVKFGTSKDWDFAWQKYNTTQVASERSLWMRALATANDPYILQQYLDAVFDRSKIRGQDVRAVIGGVASNPAGSLLAWRFVQMHWEELLDQFGAGSFTMGSIIESTTSHFSDEFDYENVKEFFRGKRVGSGKRALDQSMEQILINIHWRQRHEAEIKDWISTKIRS